MCDNPSKSLSQQNNNIIINNINIIIIDQCDIYWENCTNFELTQIQKKRSKHTHMQIT